MKRSALVFLAALCAARIAAANAADGFPGETQRLTWLIDPSVGSSPLSAREVTTPRWFIVSQTGPALNASVELVVDGTTSNNPVNFGGNALIFGKSIIAKTYSGTSTQYGFLRIIDPLKVTLPDVGWQIFPETNREAIAGMLDVPREFILSFSSDSNTGDCTNGKLRPIIDGKAMSDSSGKDIFLFQGGAVIARGKTVRVTVSGVCKPGVSFGGSIKLL